MAAFFAESMQGVGGVVQFPKGFVKAAFERTRGLGGVCISDEVQTGFGRTGEHFWGFEGHGVVPDIVTMAKGKVLVTVYCVFLNNCTCMYYNITITDKGTCTEPVTCTLRYTPHHVQ